MFFDLLSTARKKEAAIRELPPIPDTLWRPPTYFPNLSSAQVIGYDTETKELDFDNGPGWGRGAGHIIGVSVAAIGASGEFGKWYFPVRHEVERHDNLNPAHVFGWLKDVLETTPSIPKVGANLIYDNGWLATENIRPVGQLFDVQFAEALIDEQGQTALDFLGFKYCRRGKLTDKLKEWITAAYRPRPDSWRGELWRTPPRLVGPYAEDDADLPIQILPKQWAIMEQEQTLALFHRECNSIPMIVKMREPGITVDIGRAEQLRDTIEKETVELYAKLSYKGGVPIDNVGQKTKLTQIFDNAGIKYPKTPTGQPSFRKEWLNSLGETDDDATETIGSLINKIREREKLRDTFIDSYILSRARYQSGGSNGFATIYCSFHPLRGDDGGTKTGRYSSSHPNLQNIPARTKLGKQVREAFVPDQGHCGWHKKDHSQIEYRMLANYAVGPRSEEIRYRYQTNPATDYHHDTMVDVAALRHMDLNAMSKTEVELFRKPIKNVNFGLIFGQSERSLAYKAGWSEQEAKDFFASYHAGRPFVKATMDSIQSEVQALGYITTVNNRRTRFDQWEPLRNFDKIKAMPYDMAMRKFGSAIRRAYAYRGVNYRFQGSAADVLKEGMLQCYEQGVYDFIGFPKLQVHDELDWSKIAHTKAQDDAYAYAAHVMETCMGDKLRVPLKVDSSEGKSWGQCE